jgi:hypothetical protein
MRRSSAGISLRCCACGRTATADHISATRLAELLSWHRAEDGDWCVLCQWQRAHTPRVVARIHGGMDRRRFPRSPAEREKITSIWAMIRRFEV